MGDVFFGGMGSEDAISNQCRDCVASSTSLDELDDKLAVLERVGAGGHPMVQAIRGHMDAGASFETIRAELAQ
jgi:hypothetical protein